MTSINLARYCKLTRTKLVIKCFLITDYYLFAINIVLVLYLYLRTRVGFLNIVLVLHLYLRTRVGFLASESVQHD